MKVATRAARSERSMQPQYQTRIMSKRRLCEQFACSFRVVFNRGMSNADRHRLIAQAVTDSGRATVQELAELTGASDMTIRRDLDTLAAQGLLERFRGGARTLLLRGEEPPFALRAHEAVDAKRRIAAEVSRLITDGETVLLDTGTTCLEVARLLHGRQVTVKHGCLRRWDTVGVLIDQQMVVGAVDRVVQHGA